MSLFNLFRKKDKPQNELIEGLFQYLTSLHSGDRDQLLQAVVPKHGDDNYDQVMADLWLEIYAFVSDCHDNYGTDNSEIAGLENFPYHTLDDTRRAKFHCDGDLYRAEMADGQAYTLRGVDEAWRVQWPALTVNGTAMDAAMAKALTAAFVKTHASLDKHPATARDIQAALQSSLQAAMAACTQQTTDGYRVFPLHDLADIAPQPVDPSLRSALETAYENFRQSVVQKNPEALFAATRIKASEREILEKKVVSGDFADFADWIIMMNPPLAETTFVTVKTDGDDFAAYYFAWTPAYSTEVQNLSVRQFEKTEDVWKMHYTFEAGDIPLRVAAGKNLSTEILDAVETDPIIKMKRPVIKRAVQKTARYNVALKAQLDTVYDAYHQAMATRDREAFLATVRISRSDEKQIRSAYRKLFPQILAFYPPRSETTFVTLRKQDADLAGYYFIAAEPSAPEFENVLLVPFVRQAGEWKILFSLDTVPRANLLAAKNEGDRISRALELINMPGTLLRLEYVTSIFEDSLAIGTDSE